jgi:hypothetical protein
MAPITKRKGIPTPRPAARPAVSVLLFPFEGGGGGSAVADCVVELELEVGSVRDVADGVVVGEDVELSGVIGYSI